MNMDFSIIKGMFKTNADIFEKVVQGVPTEQWLTQPADDSNHLTWVAGHVVIHRAIAAEMLGAQWSAPWRKLFVRGAKLVSPDQYPNPDELRRAWKEVSEKLAACLSTATEEDIAKPAPQGVPTMDGKVGGFVAFLCLHETFHVGQLSYLKKLLGHGQTVG
jgi:uncharacterized damage-inducible protein DinB